MSPIVIGLILAEFCTVAAYSMTHNPVVFATAWIVLGLLTVCFVVDPGQRQEGSK